MHRLLDPADHDACLYIAASVDISKVFDLVAIDSNLCKNMSLLARTGCYWMQAPKGSHLQDQHSIHGTESKVDIPDMDQVAVCVPLYADETSLASKSIYFTCLAPPRQRLADSQQRSGIRGAARGATVATAETK